MFVTNKRVKLPKEIVVGSKAINDKCEEIKVSAVNSFKLLGVTIDNRLTFVEHCSNLKKIVYKNSIVLNDFSSYVHQSKFTFLKLLYFCTSIIVSHSLFISHLQPIKVLRR